MTNFFRCCSFLSFLKLVLIDILLFDYKFRFFILLKNQLLVLYYNVQGERGDNKSHQFNVLRMNTSIKIKLSQDILADILSVSNRVF